MTRESVAALIRARSRPRWLTIELYVAISTTVIGALALAAFTKAGQKPHFREIDVERINVVEPDGKVRMTISDAARSMGWVIGGKLVPGRPKEAGMLFFNDEGEEDGGLIYDGQKDTSGHVHAGAQLSFDQYDSDQIVTLTYSEENGRRRQGLTVSDRADNVTLADLVAKMQAIKALPDGAAKDSATNAMRVINGQPLAATRLFAGRDGDKTAVVSLADRWGHPRLRMSVDSAGVPGIEFLDAEGHVTRRLSGVDQPR